MSGHILTSEQRQRRSDFLDHMVSIFRTRQNVISFLAGHAAIKEEPLTNCEMDGYMKVIEAHYPMAAADLYQRHQQQIEAAKLVEEVKVGNSGKRKEKDNGHS
ncbi:hypothetical protein C4571_01965 [Candidatus Parcubacteria bacterium]|nr:MAG: hypothetical protein C4571_01965 [Candidatus Parcubacteria bacterium]